MKILIFTTAFYPSVGGLEKQTFTLIEEFLKRDHSIKLINLPFKPTSRTILPAPELKGVEIYYNPGVFKKIQLFFWCDILYMPNFSLKVIWFIFFRPFQKWIVSHNDYYLSNKKNLGTKLKLLLIKLATHNIAVSHSVASYIKTSAKVIYNCYDNDTFKIHPDEERSYDFVFLGRLVSQKGCDLLIRACKNLKEPFTLNIIGDGPEKPRLEKMVKEFQLDKVVKFLGVLEGEFLARELNRHKTIIIPSVEEEGFGIVVLEGLACGCNVIAADAGGLPEAVNGFGKTFKMGNQAELECLLQEALKDKSKHPNSKISGDLSVYLNKQKKDVVAEKYLAMFT